MLNHGVWRGIMNPDKRKDEKPIPDDIKHYLNDTQQAELSTIEGSGSMISYRSLGAHHVTHGNTPVDLFESQFRIKMYKPFQPFGTCAATQGASR